MNNKKNWAILLIFLAGMTWLFPEFNGIFFQSSNISMGEGHTTAAIFLIGGLLLWFNN